MMASASGAAAGASDGGVAASIDAAAGSVAVATGKFLAEGGKIAASFNPVSLVAGTIADSAVKAIGVLASDKYKSEFDGGTREMWSTFNRDTRVCHVCTSTITKDCKNKGSRGFWGLWDSRGVECTSNAPVESCQDIQM